MKTWDLNTGASKLDEAADSLQIAWREAGEHWDDETARKFLQDYLEPLAPRVTRALDAIHRLMQVFDKAERECSEV